LSGNLFPSWEGAREIVPALVTRGLLGELRLVFELDIDLRALESNTALCPNGSLAANRDPRVASVVSGVTFRMV